MTGSSEHFPTGTEGLPEAGGSWRRVMPAAVNLARE